MQLLDVISVEPKENNTMLLVFEDGQKRIFDISEYLNEKPFDLLKDKHRFMLAKIENGTVVWPGNIDIAPETLFDLSTAVED